jgi:hypothetical protein
VGAKGESKDMSGDLSANVRREKPKMTWVNSSCPGAVPGPGSAGWTSCRLNEGI